MTATMNGREPLTGKLGDLARYDGKVPYVDVESLTYRAWLAWKAMEVRSSTPLVHDGFNGLRFDGALSSLLWKLVPELQRLSKDERDSWQRDVREYLRATTNAVCVQHGEGKAVQWWVRREWNDVPYVARGTRYVPTYTERRLTKDEAGETREPAPVTVRHVIGEDKIDPRWRDEIIRSWRRSGEDGAARRLFTFVAQRTTSFTTHDVATALEIDVTSSPPYLMTLADVGLVTCTFEGHFTNLHMWSSTLVQRTVLHNLITSAADETVECVTKAAGVDEVMELLRTNEAMPIDAIVQTLFMDRNRLRSIIQRVKKNGLLAVKIVRGRAYYTVAQKSDTSPKPAPPLRRPAPAVPAVPVATSPVSDDAEGLAGLLEEIIQARVEQRVASVTALLDERTRDLDALAEQHSMITEERNQLQDRVDRLQARFDKLRLAMQGAMDT